MWYNNRKIAFYTKILRIYDVIVEKNKAMLDEKSNDRKEVRYEHPGGITSDVCRWRTKCAD